MSFVDVNELLINYLRPVMSHHVSARVPDPTPEEFTQVRQVGGSPVVPVRETVRLDVFCWAETDPRALELALQARAAVWALSGTTELGVVVYTIAEFLSPRLADDPDTGTPRAWATYDLTVRAEALIHPSPSI